MHSNDSGRERCIVVVDKVPNRTEMILSFLEKESDLRTKRPTRCRKVLLKRST